MINLDGKKVLLTQNTLRGFSGSEVVTLEIATYFRRHGAEVRVFTWEVDEPILSEFRARGIKVTTDDYSDYYNDLDYVWVHHQILPIGLLEKFRDKKLKLPFFFFNHMSSFKDLPIEHPYIYDLEKKLPAKSLFVSEEAKKVLTEMYGKFYNTARIFPNPFPDEFLRKEVDRSYEELRRVLVVSNHPPEEVLELEKILRTSGVVVDYLGSASKRYQLLSPEILRQYNVVISIGKTVQYCLAQAIPVYVYDQFGGCGYLSAKNFEKARYANFSGRGFRKKSAEKIAIELKEGMARAKRFQNERHGEFIREFSLSSNMEKIFEKISRTDVKLEESYISYVIASQNMARNTILLRQIKDVNEELIKTQAVANERLGIIRSFESSGAVRLARAVRNPREVLQRKLDKAREKHKKPEIVAVLCVYNEELNIDGCLRHLEKYVDKIVIFDDNSSDRSVEIARKHKKVAKIVLNPNKHEWDERENRRAVFRAALEVSQKEKVFALCIDADERFEIRFLQNLKRITQKLDEKTYVSVHFRELWGDCDHYRVDGVWGDKKKDILFRLLPNMTFDYPQKHHIHWHSAELDRELLLDYNLYHLKMIKAEDREARRQLYNNLDPEKKMQTIGYDYLVDDKGIILKKITTEERYDLTTVPDYYKS